MLHGFVLIALVILLKLCHVGYRRTNSGVYSIGMLIGVAAIIFLLRYIYGFYMAAFGAGE